MRKYAKELVILILQLFMFYIFPLFAGPTDAMGMVFLILLSALILSVVIGSISSLKIKYFYPAIIAVLFIPSVFIYYNDSALIHSLWYFVVASVGMGIGTMIRFIVRTLSRA